jgi:anthranilate synthase/aminodeoxychorismate synthase-like glutamine amidotransferase
MPARVLLIDHYDSFTYNLVHALEVLGAAVEVRAHDAVDAARALALAPTHLVISPGPGRPESVGATFGVLRALLPAIPVLGVCLGHQALAVLFGARVEEARRLVHGKASSIHHDGLGVFAGLPNPCLAGRYHSLGVAAGSLPPELTVSAWTEDGEIMGLRHRQRPAEGVQFHPESILSPEGPALLRNFLGMG